jgi:hypothetical protein
MLLIPGTSLTNSVAKIGNLNLSVLFYLGALCIETIRMYIFFLVDYFS